ncbi:MAG: zf-HC2 domain-containing protein [Candidatus Aegiribacteria sp.]
MNCSRAQRLISLVIDGQATRQQKRLLDFHLMGCSSCRRAMEMSRDISRVARTLQSPPPPEDLEKRVRRMLDSGADRVHYLHRRRSAFLTIPAAAAILILAIALLPLSSPEEPLRNSSSPALAVHDSKGIETRVPSKSGVRTVPLSAYSRQASLISF